MRRFLRWKSSVNPTSNFRRVFRPPAIDPLSTKNMDLPEEICKRALANSGVDLRRPLLLQVSRFDPWKDPLGVIQRVSSGEGKAPGSPTGAYWGDAGGDPEGWRMLETINTESAKDTDMYVFTNLAGVGNMEVNAFQRGADVVIQKSLREVSVWLYRKLYGSKGRSSRDEQAEYSCSFLKRTGITWLTTSRNVQTKYWISWRMLQKEPHSAKRGRKRSAGNSCCPGSFGMN